jgi:hypothetical protein
MESAKRCEELRSRPIGVRNSLTRESRDLLRRQSFHSDSIGAEAFEPLDERGQK